MSVNGNIVEKIDGNISVRTGWRNSGNIRGSIGQRIHANGTTIRVGVGGLLGGLL